LPALPMQKTSDPEWAHTETRPSEPEAEPDSGTDPKQAVPMQKPTPTWAQTVPAPLDESSTPAHGESGIAAPPPAVSIKDAAPPPAVSINDAAPPPEVIPAATDIWPPDPPTEHTMPAWPPSSTIHDDLPEPETIPEGEAIDSWPDSFDAVSAPTVKPPSTAPGQDLKTRPPAASTPPAIAKTVPPATTTPPAKTTPPIETTPPAATEPPVIAPTVPPAPAAAAAAARVAPQIASTPPVPEPPATPPTSSSAPAVPARASSDQSVEWPAAVPIPAWAPRIHIGSTHPDEWNPGPAQPAAQAPQPAAPAPQPAPAPKPPAVPQPPAIKQPTAQQPAATSSKSTWEVVEQKQKAGRAKVVPTPEDRSYAEWFSWAKRGGAPASACHAAAQGAFQALSSGKDVATAVQWATAAMTRPPVPVSADRQSYCAWFSLANIDLNFDQHKAHAFATAAVHALDAGADAGSAHAAGLAAAGIR
jgi:hypothetical protein